MYLLPASSCIPEQNTISRVNVISEGSPSRSRMVLRISFGITTLPRSSILLTIPVAFILCLLLCFAILDSFAFSKLPVLFAADGDLCIGISFRLFTVLPIFSAAKTFHHLSYLQEHKAGLRCNHLPQNIPKLFPAIWLPHISRLTISHSSEPVIMQRPAPADSWSSVLPLWLQMQTDDHCAFQGTIQSPVSVHDYDSRFRDRAAEHNPARNIPTVWAAV